MTRSILLQNGSVILHDQQDCVYVVDNCDILVSDGIIKQVGKDIPSSTGVDILDCTDKIVSPGFVDTHHHLWQTQLKGYGLDHCWLEYFSDDLLQSFNYTPEDIYWGQLAGCLEAIDAGTTFVLDHCHGCRTPEHAEQAIAAFTDSGIRGVFAYGETFLNLAKWDTESCVPRATSISQTYVEHVEHLAQHGPFADGRVTIGLSFDNYHLPQHEVEGLFRRAISNGVKLITSHCGNFGPSAPQVLEKYSLFPSPEDDYTIVLSHGNYLEKTDLAMISQRQIPLACTPATEAQGSMGWHLLFEPGLNTALGADCHFLNSSSLMQAARNALLFSRLQKTLELKSEGRKPVKFDETCCDVFNKATIQGARAVGMQDHIGSIQVGKQADILVFSRNSSLAFGAAARERPVEAIVGYSEPRDIEAVLVGGHFRKRAGMLTPVSKSGIVVGLDSILSELQRSQDRIRQRRQTRSLGLSKALVSKVSNLE
ncbi:cytosine deaminase [Fusarium heterosporum]|uniref:Cytosine deaminase n=1 Tax=Fusarium heterosporum TaxID=42747 RepID=A0A8H5TQL2_FUSHE|nr:cytosine deaminase [Fusarium heterosporum]